MRHTVPRHARPTRSLRRLTLAHTTHAFLSGYTLALDLTARNLQSAAKQAGNPWSVAKAGSPTALPQLPCTSALRDPRRPDTRQGYDTFCPVGDFISPEALPAPDAAR